MPDPVITHVIGTVVLLSVALLTVASVTIVQQINYLGALNAMLSEAAESCARQIVELVSVHTLGGGEYTYMVLTLPKSLGGQPYNITLENIEENKLMVIAQLQLHKQVRIVVTPNFGQAPVYAVPTAMEIGDLVISPTILLPTPQGWKAALVAVRKGDTILIGFTNQPPARVGGGRAPSCRFLDWTKSVTGLAGSEVLINFTIFNPGDTPAWMGVEVVDALGRRVGEQGGVYVAYVEDGGVAFGSIPVRLTMPEDVYVWNLVCTVGTSEPASVSVRVEVLAPRIEINVTSTLNGEAGSVKLLNVTLGNSGRVKGTVTISLDERVLPMIELLPNETRLCSFEVQLPDSPGTYGATLRVFVHETGETRLVPITITVIGNDPYIAWVNRSVVGFPGWRPKLHVVVANPSDAPVDVEVLVEGNKLAEGTVLAKDSIRFIVRPTMPAERGLYTWQVAVRKKGSDLVSSASVAVEVRDLKEVKPNTVFVNSGPHTLKDEDRYCGSEQTGNKKRCVTNLTLTDGLGEHFRYGASVALKVDLTIGGNVYRGIGLRGSSMLYEVSTYVKGSSVQLSVRSLDIASRRWGSQDLSISEKLPGAGSYPLHVLVSCDGATCVFDSHLFIGSSPISLRSSRQGDVPFILYLLVDEGTGTFSDIIVTRGDSRFVIIEGLPSGWIAELWDGGRLIARSGDGRLLVATNYILYNARLRLIDPYNEPLLPDRTIGRLIGGDVIIFSSKP